MTLPSGTLVANGNSADGSIVRTDLEYLDARTTGITRDRISTVNASSIYWDVSVPPSAMAAFGTADGITVTNRQSSTADGVQALGLPFVRRAPTSDMNLAELRVPAAAYGGFAVPQAGGYNRLHWWVHDDAAGGFRKRTYDLATSDAPEWCVAAASGIIYVSCTGTLKIRQVNTKTGAVSDFVDLSAFNAGHASGVVSVVNKVIVNRHGTYLYVIGKRSADAQNRRVFQIRIATGAVAEWTMTLDARVRDIALSYSGTVSATDATVLALQSPTATESTRIQRTLESAFGTTVSTAYTSGAVGVATRYSLIACGHHVASAFVMTATNNVWFDQLAFDESTGATAYSIVSFDTLASPAVGMALYTAGSATDGDHVLTLANNGWILTYDAVVPNGPRGWLTEPRRNFSEAAAVAAQGGICWTGRMFVAVLPKTDAQIAAGRTTVAMW